MRVAKFKRKRDRILKVPIWNMITPIVEIQQKGKFIKMGE
jgi:hypothetical protein